MKRSFLAATSLLLLSGCYTPIHTVAPQPRNQGQERLLAAAQASENVVEYLLNAHEQQYHRLRQALRSEVKLREDTTQLNQQIRQLTEYGTNKEREALVAQYQLRREQEKPAQVCPPTPRCPTVVRSPSQENALRSIIEDERSQRSRLQHNYQRLETQMRSCMDQLAQKAIPTRTLFIHNGTDIVQLPRYPLLCDTSQQTCIDLRDLYE